ncbi:unnamed protein product [Ectocarpus sp. 12 AP-2014]
MKWALFTAALYLACSTASGTSHSDHDSLTDHDSHSDGHFEAAAVYTLEEAGTHSVIAVPGEDFEGTLAFMLVPAASADDEGLEGAEEDAEAAWDAFMDGEEDATVLASGESVIPDATIVYQTTLDESIVVVPAEVTDAGAYALLLEHGGGEVSTALISPSGTAVAASVSEGMDEEEDEHEEEEGDTVSGAKWAQAIVATCIACFTSFAGIFLLINKRIANGIDLSHAYMFATGAVLTAALIHIIPESFERFEDAELGLHDLGIHTGVTILAGITASIIIRAVCTAGHTHTGAPATAKVVEADGSQSRGPTTPTIPENLWELVQQRKGKALFDFKGLKPICWNVIVGDAVHSFTCGFTIGAAFLSCGSTMGWTITASTLIHEVPSEMADFVALLNGGMSIKQALTWNLVSGIPAILGAVLILALGDQFTNFQIAIILLLGAGSFIFIGLTELLPEALSSTVDGKGLGDSLRKLGSFVFGALIIGIPLMFHAHCHAGEGHEGHDH